MDSKVEENYKRLREELNERLNNDKRLTEIMDKIRKGTATFKDSAEYSQIVADHMGDVISKNIGNIKIPMGKEMVCKELLKENIERVDTVFGKVQVSVDEKMGIHLNPVTPPYPTERVNAIAHSLEDPNADDEKVARRGKSSGNVVAARHDENVKANAAWREKAGFDCYLVRDAGGGCCPWCAALEGRYEYASAPDDIFRRHDHCTCIVTYECGRKRQDVWSKKTWEADPKDIEARKAASEAARPTVKTPAEAEAINEQSKSNITVLSKEQAEAINEQNKPTVFTEAEAKEREAMALGKDDNVNNNSVDNGGENDIIESDTLKMAASQQNPPDFSKYKVETNLKSVEDMRQKISESLGIPLSDIELDGIQNTEVLEPFVKRLEKIQKDTGMKFPSIRSASVIDGDETCITGYKRFENTLYISSKYFNSKEATLDTLKDWANNGIMPKHAKTIAYLAEHEAAHIRIPIADIENEEAFTIFRKAVRKGLCENDKNIYEFFADCSATDRTGNHDSKMQEAIDYLNRRGGIGNDFSKNGQM